MLEISRRQLEILQYLHKYSLKHHCAPSYRELAARFGWASPQASLGHLRALARKRCVTPILSATGVSRGYRVTPEGKQLLGISA